MDQLISTFRFRIGGQLGPVIVRLWRDTTGDAFSAEYSHHLRTPLQAGISTPQPWTADTPEKVVRSIAATLDSEFEQSLEAGHQPSDAWLVCNERWR